MSDDLVAGLDISGFSPEKLKILKDYVLVFKNLEKYDGKSFRPVSGDGMASFNNSAKETNELLSQINFKLATLNSNATFARTSVNSLGTDGVRSMRRLTEEVTRTRSAVESAGKALTGMWSLIRNIAYVVPALGIGGVIAAIGTGLSTVWDKLTGFNTDLAKSQAIQTSINSDLLEQIKSYENLYQAKKKLYDLENENSERNKKDRGDITKAGGANAQDVIANSINAESIGYKELLKRINERGGILGIAAAIKNNAQKSAEEERKMEALRQVENSQEVKDIKTFLSSKKSVMDIFKEGIPDDLLKAGGKAAKFDVKENILDYIDFGEKRKSVDILRFTPDQMKAAKEAVKSRQDIINKELELDLKLYEQFTGKKASFDKLSAEQMKINNDQSRKAYVNNETERLKTIINTNDLIAKDMRSTDDEIIQAKKNSSDARVSLIGVGLYDVVKNSTSTPKERNSALIKSQQEIKRETENLDKDIFNTKEDFRQRDLQSNLETEKNKLDAIAITNERIFQNDKNSLQERLDAFAIYVKNKNEIAYAEEKRELDVIGLSSAKKKEITSNREKNVSSNTANSEKVLFDIVQSWADKTLKEVKDTNQLQEENYDNYYANELEKLNKSFQDKEISFKNFMARKKNLDANFKIQSESENLKNDLQSLARLRKDLKDKEKLRDDYAEDVNKAKTPKEKEDAIGKYDAALLSVDNSNKAIMIAQNKYNKDSADLAKAQNDLLIQGQKEFASNNKKIQQDLFNFGRTLLLAGTDNAIAQIQREQQVKDQQIDSELSAIEKSSLAQKDKTALEIQLNQQKKESDKAAAVEERRLKTEAAVLDRNLNIAHILWGTEEAVIEALTLPFPLGESIAIQRAILGGIALATVLATPIPSFAEGVQNFEGGMARFGEAGPEIIKKPYQSPYLVYNETIGYLPKGTDVIPLRDSPEFGGSVPDSGWEQTKWLAKQISKGNKKVETKITNVININTGFENYKKNILGN